MYFVIGAVVALAALALISMLLDKNQLEIRLQESDVLIESFPLPNKSEFSIRFIHSVNQSPVEDVFINDSGIIKSVRTIYYEFGAGVQTELDEGETFIEGEDGEIIIQHVPKAYDGLHYIVGTVSDHVLQVDGRDISLRDLCGPNAKITLRLK